jgi:hypothetical protein
MPVCKTCGELIVTPGFAAYTDHDGNCKHYDNGPCNCSKRDWIQCDGCRQLRAPEFSVNTWAYIHWNEAQLRRQPEHIDKHLGSACVCRHKALQLGLLRRAEIRRGNPDLESELEAAIWKRAFQMHVQRGSHITNYCDHIIAPKWAFVSNDKSAQGRCDCFERAWVELALQAEPIDSSEHYYEVRT